MTLLVASNLLGLLAIPFGVAGSYWQAHHTAQAHIWFPIFLVGSTIGMVAMLCAQNYPFVGLELYYTYTNLVGTKKAYRR